MNNSRGNRLLKLCLNEFNNNEDSESPADDSDKDPDYDPNKTEGKQIPQYFKESDIFPELNNKADRQEPVPKKIKVIDYTNETDVFPSPTTWELETLNESEKNSVIENAKILLDFQHQSVANNETNGQSPSKIITNNTLSASDIFKNVLQLESHNKKINSVGSKKQKRTNKSLEDKELQFLPPCQTTCRKKCFEKLNSDQRNEIFVYYKTLNFSERYLFLNKYILKQPVKYRKVDAETNKNCSIVYNLPTIETNVLQNRPDNEAFVTSKNMIPVCKTMFLHTLGYKSDGIVTSFLKRTANDLPCLEDRRGKANALKMKDISEKNYNLVKEHIDTYHPLASHYNIEHAPNRRYLPPDLTIRQMHKDFILKYNHLSYETYRKIFEKENIGFSSPTQDDCSICSIFKNHSHPNVLNSSELSPSNSNSSSITLDTCNTDQETNIAQNDKPQACSICDNYEIHKRRYTVARQKYNEDVSKEWDDSQELYSVDMQKVLILPKMTIKNSFFISRLVVFHETFANLKQTGQNICVLWHEAITGRNGPDVVSAYYNALITLDNKTKDVIFWADNCTAQNKNWALFTACIIFVNEDWGPETITFKYFEPGHSFMRADSIHGQIGKQWNKTPEILDYEDLQKLILSSNKRNVILSLRAEDFKLFENGCVQRKKESAIPKLNDIKSVQFRKGSKKIFFKQELENDEFLNVSILKPKFKLEVPKSIESDRGINFKKKETILKELLPHMPPRKQIFWKNLPSFENLEDLGEVIPQF